MCEEYLITFHKNDLIDILQEDNTSKHFSININFVVLYESHQNLGLELIENPEESLAKWDNAAIKAQMAILKEVDIKCHLKCNIHCRIYQLATCLQSNGASFPGNNDVGKFIQLSGTVMRISGAKLLEYQRNYICAKCKTPEVVKAEYERKYMIKNPKKCQNLNCSGKNLIHLGELDSDNCKDYQEIKIQERVKDRGMSAIHNTMVITLEDDLVDSCKPGDNITVCGIIKRRWGEFDKGKKIDINITLKANYLQVDNKSFRASSTPETIEMFNTFWENHSYNPLLGRDMILKSVCPQIYGLYLVKLAISVIIAGGSPLEDTTLTGVRTRSESHLLLVGDPGTGKSQLLRFASKVVPRSVLTTGIGSTAAGLTVTAIMERGEWQLEAGALVLSDGGICCIDEFNSMKEHDRTSIHEAMEQQTISIAKASLVCKLNTRCSILAACNPKGNVDPSQPLCMSTALPSPLLSRFDLILVLRDVVNQEWDGLVADYILNGQHNFSKFAKNRLWTTDILQSYFVVIKKFQPKLTQDAEIILSSYYQLQRRMDNRNKARTTVRLLESLVRLSQGHARLMYHEQVEIVDSIYAIVLVDAAMETESIIFNLNLNINSVFPEKPSSNYRRMLEEILNKLQLQAILEKELVKLNKSKESNVQSRFFFPNDKNREPDDTQNKRKSTEENAETSNKLKRNDVLNSETESSKISEIVVMENTFKVPKKTKSINISSFEDEGYDTVSFTSNNSHKTLIDKGSTDVNGLNYITFSCKSTVGLPASRTDADKSNEERTSRPSSSKSTVDLTESRTDADESKEETTSSSKSTMGLTASSTDADESKEEITSRPSTIKSIVALSAARTDADESKEDRTNRPSSSKSAIGVPTTRTSADHSKHENNIDKRSTIKGIIKSTRIISKNSKEECNDTTTNNTLKLNPNEVEKAEDPLNKSTSSNETPIRKRLKRFKYTPRPKNQDPENNTERHATKDIVSVTTKQIPNSNKNFKNVGNISNNVDNNRENKTIEFGKACSVGASKKNDQNKIKISKKSSSPNSIKNDTDLLKFMPGVNDNFDVDLDFDWDNFGNNCLSSTMVSQGNTKENCKSSSSAKYTTEVFKSNALTNCIETPRDPESSASTSDVNKERKLEDLSQNSKMKYIHDKFSFKPKFFKKISSDRSSVKTKSDSSISSVTSFSQHKTIFETDEDIDLDF